MKKQFPNPLLYAGIGLVALLFSVYRFSERSPTDPAIILAWQALIVLLLAFSVTCLLIWLLRVLGR